MLGLSLRAGSWLIGLIIAFACAMASAAEPTPMRKFDHDRTGFALTGVHSKAKCETCHVLGTFRGTPKDCVSCHRSGRNGATAIPSTHIPTTASCDSCHRTEAWSPAEFKHAGIAAGSCTGCHNGVSARGKSAEIGRAHV